MKTTLNVAGMSCEHCVKHVTNALKALPGVQSVEVNLGKKNAQVEHEERVSIDALKAAITEEGYEVV
ncbi:MAG: copper ion binding protein [Spirochaetaceae bacterium]|jgi:copper ion binding protein|nr:copper ion binding protein [Spirochaetaceae bacterium]